MGMDTFAALALATEPPNDSLMDRKPASKTEKIVNAVMWRNIFGQGVYQLIVLMSLLLFGADLFGFTFERDTPFYYNEETIQAMKDDVGTGITQAQADAIDGMLG